jgi:hypothetical protein
MYCRLDLAQREALIRRSLACAFSLERMRRMTSSMSSRAMSRPSTRCSRSWRFLVRRNSLRRRDDLEAVVEEDLEQFLEAQRARLAVDQRHVVDAEGLLHRRQPVELLGERPPG